MQLEKSKWKFRLLDFSSESFQVADFVSSNTKFIKSLLFKFNLIFCLCNVMPRRDEIPNLWVNLITGISELFWFNCIRNVYNLIIVIIFIHLCLTLSCSCKYAFAKSERSSNIVRKWSGYWISDMQFLNEISAEFGMTDYNHLKLRFLIQL